MKQILDYIFKSSNTTTDLSKHRVYTIRYEDLCQ
jgi:hypothetical protein